MFRAVFPDCREGIISFLLLSMTLISSHAWMRKSSTETFGIGIECGINVTVSVINYFLVVGLKILIHL